jgi:deferrochelatase/peroxidase EfeB
MTSTQHVREQPSETEARTPPPIENPKRGSSVSRRGVLGAAGAGLAGLAAGAAAGFAYGGEQSAPVSQVPGTRTYPFYGEHQAGILTAVQDRLHFAAFDVTTDSREELVQLLNDWTTAAARMTQGLGAGELGPTSGPYRAPPDDTGEAIGLPAAGLTITFGFVSQGRQEPVRVGRSATRCAATAAPLSRRQAEPAEIRRRPVRPGVC